MVTRAVREIGIGYRRNARGLPGSADFVDHSKSWATIVNGCWWHRSDYYLVGTDNKLPNISNADLKNWRELQSEVAKILRECGFTVKEPYTIETARGKVEIDVFAEEILDKRKNLMLFECKYWKSRIPKNVVHAFRTVVADTGANAGYVITSNGYQSGAKPAAPCYQPEIGNMGRIPRNI